MRDRDVNGPETLAGLAEKGLDVLCICDRCTRFVPLKTADLINRLGADIGVPSVRRHVICGCCGLADKVETRPNWPSHGAAPKQH